MRHHCTGVQGVLGMGHKDEDQPGAYSSDKASEDTYATTGATGAGTGTGVGGGSLATAGAYDQPSGRPEEPSLTGAGSSRGYAGSGYQGDSYARTGAPEQPVGGGYTGGGYEGREGAEGEAAGEEGHKPGMMEKVKASCCL
jgi:hypothetical protein